MTEPLPQPAPPLPAAGRRTDLDALRILACAAIVLAHAALIFAAEPRYHLKSAEPSLLATILYEPMRIGVLAVFFALAGWSSVVALRRRAPMRFLRERALRTLVPLGAGIVLLGPVIKYVELSNGRDLRLTGLRLVPPLEIGLLEFLARYPTRLSLLTWSHLWFLAYLFAISALLLPVLAWLARRPPAQAVPGRGLAFLPALPMAGLILATGGYWPFLPNLVNDGPNFAHFALCLLLGAGIAAWPGLEARLRAEAPVLLGLALAGLAGMLLLGESPAGRVLAGLTAWGAIGAAFGFAGRFRPRATPLLNYLAEATMPVYVLHHIPVLLLAMALLPLGWPVVVTIGLLWGFGIVVSLALHHWLVRPYAAPRWLLGLDARGAAPSRRDPVPITAASARRL